MQESGWCHREKQKLNSWGHFQKQHFLTSDINDIKKQKIINITFFYVNKATNASESHFFLLFKHYGTHFSAFEHSLSISHYPRHRYRQSTMMLVKCRSKKSKQSVFCKQTVALLASSERVKMTFCFYFNSINVI